MPKAFSTDIRYRVAKLFKNNIKYKDIAERLSISLTTVKRYANIYKLDPMINKKIPPKRQNTKITNLDKLEEFIKQHNYMSLMDISKEWGNISPEGIRKNIKKLGYTYKKKLVI
jgi:transposase